MADWAATGGCPSDGGGTRGRAAPGDAVGVSARRPAASARGWDTLTRMRAHEGRGGPRGGALMTGKRAHQGDRTYPYDGGSSSSGGRGHATPRRPVPRAAPATCERAWRDGARLHAAAANAAVRRGACAPPSPMGARSDSSQRFVRCSFSAARINEFCNLCDLSMPDSREFSIDSESLQSRRILTVGI